MALDPVVLDTNVIVAALRSRHGASNLLVQHALTGALPIALSAPIVLEYESVLKRDAVISAYYQTWQIESVLDALCAVGRLHAIHFSWAPYTPDPQDDHVLSLAANARCRWIVTFNRRHFRGVQRFGIEVVEPSALLRWLEV